MAHCDSEAFDVLVPLSGSSSSSSSLSFDSNAKKCVNNQQMPSFESQKLQQRTNILFSFVCSQERERDVLEFKESIFQIISVTVFNLQ